MDFHCHKVGLAQQPRQVMKSLSLDPDPHHLGEQRQNLGAKTPFARRRDGRRHGGKAGPSRNNILPPPGTFQTIPSSGIPPHPPSETSLQGTSPCRTSSSSL